MNHRQQVKPQESMQLETQLHLPPDMRADASSFSGVPGSGHEIAFAIQSICNSPLRDFSRRAEHPT
jgi:hypothetical protein